ncbi:MAG: SPOR domain-containing protein [Candidatus Latescibacterota bacterium]|nr:MAG: SPOR domain-containing protein [Candidatus Latescibacterota bacterium]
MRRSRHERRAWSARALGVLGLLVAASGSARAGVIDEARALKRQLHYREASDLLRTEMSNLEGDERAEATLLLASLSTNHKEARRLLREAARASDRHEIRRRVDVELARLDFARGNYNSVRTRLERYDDDEAGLLLAQAYVALKQPDRAAAILRDLGGSAYAELLRGWAAREMGDTRAALERFTSLAQTESDVLPIVLLWKSECEAQLDLRDPALATAALLQRRFPTSAEAVLIEPTLAALRRMKAEPAPARDEAVVLQLGAFEDRSNALRFRDTLPRHIRPVTVDEVRSGARRIYRVHVGPFETRAQAEAWARENLDPLDRDWSIGRPEGP